MTRLVTKPPAIQYHDIIITDITFHVARARNPKPWYRKVIQNSQQKRKQPGRFFINGAQSRKDGTIVLPMALPPELQREKEEAEKEGKVVRFFMPKEGIPLIDAPDVVEYVNSRDKSIRTLTGNNLLVR